MTLTRFEIIMWKAPHIVLTSIIEVGVLTGYKHEQKRDIKEQMNMRLYGVVQSGDTNITY